MKGPKVVGEFSAVATAEGIMALTGWDWRERNRLARYSGDTHALLAGEISDDEFAKRWHRRVRQVGDHTLEEDPQKVRAAWATLPCRCGGCPQCRSELYAEWPFECWDDVGRRLAAWLPVRPW
jgi:hypothetical protein